MSDATKTIVAKYGRINATRHIEKALDFLNNKLYLYTIEYMENDAYTDTYAHYATLQIAYINMLKDLKEGG